MADETDDSNARATAAARSIIDSMPESTKQAIPKIAIVCGSGLGGLQHTVDEAENSYPEIAYKDIPDFPRPTVLGHEGKIVFGTMGKAKVPVVLLVGRVHFYEGHSMELVAFATRVCRELGVDTVILTNAAGGLNKAYSVGDIMLLSDHLNLAGLSGLSPLLGPNNDAIGPRFPPLSDAYDLDLRRRAHRVWRKMYERTSEQSVVSKRTLREGTYAFAAGPNYETRAEARLLATHADVVGMSTVPEVIVARHAGMRVLAMSLVTNSVVLEPGIRGDDPAIQEMTKADLEAHMAKGRANHAEVVSEGAAAAETMMLLVKGIVDDLAEDLG